ncbi:glycosyltransferase, MGT family [Chitinophaga costaii]|uniref:Glycosyltransferase, MGT family n=1 Tax=Chitinophaga costaii TaxID=1335309 RepID=A0A1C3ZX40_9BACT|nr:nucleotide disphospho-sugar-binding domain-containing protein [Chitinophaga costaii]PUZ30538.1 glycosyltransferase [Chitinophaga costaii]SCB86856.1 glycosyltransferase, MGT family [Chitinophaga costaii]
MQTKKILFVTIPEKGHINPMIGVAQHLQAMGYELAFFAQVDISLQLRRAGLQGQVYHDPSPVNIDPQFITKGADFVKKLANKEWLRQWIKTLLIDAVPGQVQLLDAVVKNFAPSLIVTDPMVYAAALVAHTHNLPWVGISSSLNPITPDDWQCELTDTLHTLEPLRNALFEAQGLLPRFKVSDAISPWLNIVFATETYMPRHICGNDFSYYAGNSFPMQSRGDETDFPFHRLEPGKRKVYMSMGSQIYYHPHLFSTVAQALYDDDIQLVFAINELLNTPFADTLPRHVMAVSYAPQLQLLPYIDLVISHGGANSAMEALANGVPLALLPICNDQFLQAQFVTRAGAGIVLNPHLPSATRYREQLLPLLQAGSPVRAHASSIGASFRAKTGPLGAAQEIEKLFLTRQPFHPLL